MSRLIEHKILDAQLDCDDARVRSLLKGMLPTELRNLADACDEIAEKGMAEVAGRED